MKIYQIHKYGGNYEDYFDYIVSSYLSKEKAIIERRLLEKDLEESRKCCSCQLYYCDDTCQYNDCDKCNERNLNKIDTYCSRYEPCEWNKYKCINYSTKFNEINYSIEEVEVIE